MRHVSGDIEDTEARDDDCIAWNANQRSAPRMTDAVQKTGRNLKSTCVMTAPRRIRRAARKRFGLQKTHPPDSSASPCAPDPSDARLHLSSSSPGQSSEPPGSAQDFLDSPPCLVAAGVCADEDEDNEGLASSGR